MKSNVNHYGRSLRIAFLKLVQTPSGGRTDLQMVCELLILSLAGNARFSFFFFLIIQMHFRLGYMSICILYSHTTDVFLYILGNGRVQQKNNCQHLADFTSAYCQRPNNT